MRFLLIALLCALWQGEAARARANLPARVILGIDLGTTNSAMALVIDGIPQIITNVEGKNTTPSVVNLLEGGGVGEAALRMLERHPDHVIHSVKRIIGHTYAELQGKGLIDNLPYRVVEGENGMAAVEVDGKQYLPQMISALVLAKLKADAESTLGVEIKEAVITVPARFNDSQRRATIEAGKLAGLEVQRIVSEPTAAALATIAARDEESKVVVYDLGGGTFDVSILDLSKDDGTETKEVLTTEGDPLLGGDDFDNRIVNYLVDSLKASTGVDVSGDQEALAELKVAAVEAKETLTSAESTAITIRKLGEEGLTTDDITLTRARFNELIADLVSRTIDMTEQALANEELSVGDIDHVLLVGGSTRVVAVTEAVAALFGQEKLSRVDNPDEVVALGAAVQAGIVSDDVDITIVDRTALPLGIETRGDRFVVIIPKDTAIPAEVTKDGFTTVDNNQTAVLVNIYQGDGDFVEYNEKIGELEIKGIPPAPRGVPRFEVTFKIDANSVLDVTVKDVDTGKEENKIVAANYLSDEHIAEMRKAMDEDADKIKAKLRLVDARNELDGLVLQAEAMLLEYSDKLVAESKSKMEQAVAAAKESLNSEELTAVENAIKGFQSQLYAVRAELFGKKGDNSKR